MVRKKEWDAAHIRLFSASKTNNLQLSLLLAIKGDLSFHPRDCIKTVSRLLTTVSSFLTSSTARSSFSFARFSESSTVISTCSSSLRCSQFGFPLFCSSWKTKLVSFTQSQGLQWDWLELLLESFYIVGDVEPSTNHQLGWFSSDEFGGWWHHHHRVWSLDCSTSSPCSVNCFLM